MSFNNIVFVFCFIFSFFVGWVVGPARVSPQSVRNVYNCCRANLDLRIVMLRSLRKKCKIQNVPFSYIASRPHLHNSVASKNPFFLPPGSCLNNQECQLLFRLRQSNQPNILLELTFHTDRLT